MTQIDIYVGYTGRMRADRLLAILMELQARGRTTTRRLARKLEVSDRTIHRDMDALSTAGVPVYAERGARGGWELAEGYRTNLTGMTREEIVSLVLTTASSGSGAPGFRRNFDRAMTKLLAAVPPAHKREAELARERIHVDGAGWFRSAASAGRVEEVRRKEAENLQLLQEAVWADFKTAITYAKHDGTTSVRTVQPLGLVAKNGAWYLVANGREGVRTFRIARIVSVAPTRERFERPPDFILAEHWERSMRDFRAGLPSYRVRLRVAAAARTASLMHLHVISDEPAPEHPGQRLIEADLETRQWAIQALAGLGAAAEVLAPAELREDMLRISRELQALYAPAASRSKSGDDSSDAGGISGAAGSASAETD